jgi:hypothetical protein
MSGAKDGMYFTDGTDTSGLTALFENSGYTVTDQRQRLSLPALAAKLLTDSVLSRAISAAMLGLIFCFSYVVLTVYRENDRRYQIYHLFGLSKARLFLRSTLTAMGIALTAEVKVLAKYYSKVQMVQFGIDNASLTELMGAIKDAKLVGYANHLDWDSDLLNSKYSHLQTFIDNKIEVVQTDYSDLVNSYLKEKGLR